MDSRATLDSNHAYPYPRAALHRFIRLVQPAGQKNRDLRAAKSLPSHPGRGGAMAKAVSRRDTPRRRFQLPPLPRRLDTVHTILQPQFAPEMTPPASMNLPEVFFWAPQLRLPTFVAPFRTPGNQAAPTQARTLNAPPKLQAPTLEPPDISTQTPLESLSKLSARFPSTLPVRTSEDAVKWSAASADPTPGDPTALLSLSLDPSRVPEFLSVPPGNQLGRTPEAAASGAISASAAGTSTGGHATGKPSGSAGSEHTGAGSGGDHPASAGSDSSKSAAAPKAAASAGKPVQPSGTVAAETASAENDVVLTLAGLVLRPLPPPPRPVSPMRPAASSMW